MRGVKPDNFEAEACNIFKCFRLLSPVIEALSKSFFRRRKAVENKSRSLALLLQLGRRLSTRRQVALRDEVWPTEACATALSRH